MRLHRPCMHSRNIVTQFHNISTLGDFGKMKNIIWRKWTYLTSIKMKDWSKGACSCITKLKLLYCSISYVLFHIFWVKTNCILTENHSTAWNAMCLLNREWKLYRIFGEWRYRSRSHTDKGFSFLANLVYNGTMGSRTQFNN